ncbi:cytoplasmic protein [Ectobacillus sp. JY-23]|uniref:cytoplasmic protein n=1 Tax=Ectobacillus sp. JY-23 TaxID=2933872 RepID=UPI001FF36CB4|nr:cytoplasmic protein [Ectobacillus sp. JY-23]UOY92251.1 cytoplasmic protein [Ectobacillus sp. JY-23]
MEDYLWTLHQHSSNHRTVLEQDSLCGCFHCLRLFHPSLIDEWIDDTACCPYCGMDAIISESAGAPMTKEFLQQMKDVFFYL